MVAVASSSLLVLRVWPLVLPLPFPAVVKISSRLPDLPGHELDANASARARGHLPLGRAQQGDQGREEPGKRDPLV